MEENQIVNSNAEGQESATATEATTATTNAPAENGNGKKWPAPTPHDDFDWTIDKRNVAAYNKEEKEKYDKVYENTFVQINDGELIKGTIVGLTKTDVVLNIGFKSSGLLLSCIPNGTCSV